MIKLALYSLGVIFYMKFKKLTDTQHEYGIYLIVFLVVLFYSDSYFFLNNQYFIILL
ncbi:hypothetical protein LV92_00242 [Arenibacter echinorum]|uniref:Uncharacterized protein n=1 Tax=Arenibacter echinorum TaxID=440515 RepID=A0A327RIZ8_9FLAO|nr:hypothetical protein LV92_00242 [Arenibacter echinorum]